MTPSRPSRRRLLLGALGTAGVAATAGTIRALTTERIAGPATATQQAVRLDPPDPVGGWVPGNLYVALYGHPGSATLGALGEQHVAAAVERAGAVAAPYGAFGRPVVPTFEIITTVVPSQAREIEGLLAQPNVSLALDPEWRVGPTQRPGGGFIGTVDGAEVNAAVEYLDGVIRRFSLPPKMLVVHQFADSMVTDKAIIRGTANVHVVFQMDGFGTLSLKLGSWNRMVADLPPGASTGWKNFYDEDRPTPTPAQSLSVRPTPIYVSYQ